MSYSNRQLIVAKAGVLYGASVSNSATETATNPSNLAAGAIGVFYWDGTNYSLVSASAPSTSYAYSGSSGAHGMQKIILAAGTTNGVPVLSSPIDGKDIQVFFGKAYLSPVKEVVYIGTDGTTGLGLFGATAATASATYGIGTVKRSKQQYPRLPKLSATITSATSDPYSIAAQLVANANTKTQETTTSNSATNNWPMLAEIIGTGVSGQANWTNAVSTSTGVVNALRFTAGSTTVELLEDASGAWAVPTSATSVTITSTAGDILGVANANMTSATFTALILGSGAGNHLISIGNTVYTVPDGGSAAQNAVAIAAVINAGTLATATVATAAVTITLKDKSVGAKILVRTFDGTSTYSTPALSAITTIGTTTSEKLFKVVTGTAISGNITIDRPAGFSGIFLMGTSVALNTGVVTGGFAGTSPGTGVLGIKLTGNVSGQKTDINLYGNLAGCNIIYSQAPSLGSGTSAEVTDAEIKANTLSRSLYSPGAAFPEPIASNVVAGELYDIITITFNNKVQSGSAINETEIFPIHLQVALPHGDSYANTTLGLLNGPSDSLFGDSAGYLNLWATSCVGGFNYILI